jgi:hypothetical protein
MIDFLCFCGKAISASAEDMGRTMNCPACGRTLTVPSLEDEGPGPRLSREPQPAAQGNGTAVTSLVLGILSFLLPVLLSIPAIIAGFMGLSAARQGQGGKNMAAAGIVTGFFTLVSGAAAIAYIFLVIVPYGHAMRDTQTNLKQIGVAMHNYHDVYKQFPNQAIYSKDGKPLLSWRVAILPYIEQNHLFNQFKLNEPWDSPHNSELLLSMPPQYGNPLDRASANKGLTPYQVFVGEAGVEPRPVFVMSKTDAPKLLRITDGASNTLMVVESGEPVPWTAPQDIFYQPNRPLPKLGLSGNFFFAVLADGHVRAYNTAKINEKNLRLLITMNDGMPIDFE